MNELDAFEKSIKAELEGFDQIKPSKVLWFKINATLMIKWLLNPRVLLSSVVTIIILLSFGWLLSSDTAINVNDNQTQKLSVQVESNRTYSTPEPLTKEIGKSQSIKGDELNNLSIKNNNINTSTQKHSSNNKSNTTFIKVKTSTNKTINSEQENENTEGSKISYVSEKKTANNRNTKEKTSGFVVNSGSEVPGNNKKREEELLIKGKPLPWFRDFKSYSIMADFQPPYNHYVRNFWFDYEVYAGAGFTHSELIFNPEQNFENPLTTSYHIGGGIVVNYNRWFVRSGLEYSRLSKKYSYESNYIAYDSTTFYYTVYHNNYVYDTIGWNTNIGGGIDSIPIIGLTVIQSQTQESYLVTDSSQKTINQKLKNSYSMVNIPLVFGRSFNYKGFVFDLAAGINWTHIVSAEAWVIDSKTNSIIKIDQSSNLINKDFYTGLLSFGAGYRFSESSLIFIRPELQYNLNSANSNQKIYQYRITTGLRFTLN